MAVVEVAMYGTSRPASTNNIVAVANLSGIRRDLAGSRAVGWRSSIQRDPSQNMGWLRSATRLTAGVPWLCDPASRRVCYFVGPGIAHWSGNELSRTDT